jgi:hypothetical protein
MAIFLVRYLFLLSANNEFATEGAASGLELGAVKPSSAVTGFYLYSISLTSVLDNTGICFSYLRTTTLPRLEQRLVLSLDLTPDMSV